MKAAIDDMENLYQKCSESGRLASKKFDFMKSKLTETELDDIQMTVEKHPRNYLN